MAPRGLGIPAFLLFLIFLLLPACAGAASPSSTGGCAPGAYLAAWRAEAVGRAVEGSACWIVGGGGELRIEVGFGGTDGAPIERLFSQVGDGWSLVLGEPGQGTINPWAEAWREVTPGLESWVRAFLLCSGQEISRPADGSGGARPRFLLKRRSADVYRWIAPRLALDSRTVSAGSVPAAGFRKSLVRRGSGRGSEQEIVRLEVFRPAGPVTGWAPGTRLRAASSRRPGHLEWTILRRSTAFEAPAEVFLPLWPLAQFIDPDTVFPGTR